MEKLHIRNIFRLFVPLHKRLGAAETKTEPKFGLSIRQSNIQFDLNIKLECTDRLGNVKYQPDNCFSWAKRNPVLFQSSQDSQSPDGVILRLKINQGVFDFRRFKSRIFQIIVECYNENELLQRGKSALWELLPKKRQAEENEFENEGNISKFRWFSVSHLMHKLSCCAYRLDSQRKNGVCESYGRFRLS